ncbi:UNKNOWN [Stylonychia lemnae]|uniref:Uncharacterized protein n=1 Tax=Stylonychia lemnae TaxID=5949 RepID=A0A077ZSS3_STYLE|nr:UNKNOWN [Stylonychia lemnae]|eukprot:CDW72933.1 UNKNOWN [Stylonychia lemnae]
MRCYEEPRHTNEETDACATSHRNFMTKVQEELTQSLMAKSKALETCTDYCKDEQDLNCINKCGTKYLKDLHQDFDDKLKRYIRDYSKIQ